MAQVSTRDRNALVLETSPPPPPLPRGRGRGGARKRALRAPSPASSQERGLVVRFLDRSAARTPLSLRGRSFPGVGPVGCQGLDLDGAELELRDLADWIDRVRREHVRGCFAEVERNEDRAA